MVHKSSSQEKNFDEANGNGKAFSALAERHQLASVSTTLLLAVGIGIFEGLALYFGSGMFLNLMGISSGYWSATKGHSFWWKSNRSIYSVFGTLSLSLGMEYYWGYMVH